MKELSIEEKAKAYDEAVKKARKLATDLPNGRNDRLYHIWDLENIFPEIKESEDERIRKEIIYHIQNCDDTIDEQTKKRMIAWLEKQGEHANFRNKIQIGDKVTRNKDGVLVNLSQLNRVAKKDEKQAEQKLSIEKLPSEMKTIEESLGFTTQEECDKYNQMVSNLIMSNGDNVKPKFKVGDWVVSPNGVYWHIDAIQDGRYEVTADTGQCGNWPLDTNIYRLWTIDDAKAGDVLAVDPWSDYPSSFVAIYKKQNGEDFDSYCFVGFDGKFYKSENGHSTEEIHPATKEQRNLLFQKMKEASYEWDAEKKELRKIELTDVDHEYYSELLKNDKSDNIADYAYQCVYCMSHDWANETPTWDDVQKACRLGAKWNEKRHKSTWSEEDEKMIGRIRSIIEAYAFSQSAVDVNGDLCEKEYIDADIWLKSLKQRATWKPSDEQMKALKEACDKSWEPDGLDPLYTLYEQLKKL